MALNAAPDAISAAARPMGTAPIAFEGLSGWFSPGLTSRGVILCGTWGYEQLCAHRPWRDLAESIAATGCSVLRFDYPGSGNSGDTGAGTLEGWLEAIRAGIRTLRERAGAQEIVLVGLRMGASLAAIVAGEGGIDRLVLLAPFASGRSYLREMKLQAMSVCILPDGTPLPPQPGTLNVGGFLIGPDLAAELAEIDLLRTTAAPAPQILLLGSDTDRLASRYRALGAAVATGPLAGLTTLVANPLFTRAPEEAFAAVVAFAAEEAKPRLNAPPTATASAHLEGDGWREESQWFDGRFGILCRPADRRSAATVLFLSCGVNANPGWGRQTTALARRLAGAGYASLRFDLLGVGDSARRADGASPIYNPDALTDVRAALDHLEARPEVAGPFAVVGTCSGAYLAYKAACADSRVTAAVAINLFCFDWNPTQDLETVLRNGFRSAATYSNLMRQGGTWRRLLRGQIRVGAIAATLARRSLARLGRRLGGLLRPGASAAGCIKALRRRGGHLLLIYSSGEPGLEELHAQLGRSPAKLARRLGRPAEILEGADHNLSTAAAQGRVADLLEDLLAELTKT